MKKLSQLLLKLFVMVLTTPLFAQIISTPTLVEVVNPVEINYTVTGDLVKKVNIDLEIDAPYANLSLYADDQLLIDNIDIPTTGLHQLSSVIQFESAANVDLKIVAFGANITVNTMDFVSANDLVLPQFTDISVSAGLDRVNSHKYAGPCVADINNDGYYDFIVVNHNDEPNKIYWNNGDGTVTQNDQNLSRWEGQDLHGVTAADYDNDGDLDIIQTKGGGNGATPSYPDVYRNDDGIFVLVTGDIGFNAENARGRGGRFSDMDGDGDLDVMLVNAQGINGETLVHVFYENKGDGTFDFVRVAGIDGFGSERALFTDVNGDQIDDIIIYGWNLSLWIGNGDFTFTEATSQFPASLPRNSLMGVTDIDIDNDGDLDLYFARGFPFGIGTTPTFDFDPVEEQMAFKVRNGGTYEIDFSADGDIQFQDYEYSSRGGFDPSGTNFPIYLGSAKTVQTIQTLNTDLTITQAQADGWPTDFSQNGIYIGHIGGGEWKSAVVINGNLFWGVAFSINGTTEATPSFTPLNRNVQDVLLRNDGGSFTDVSDEWNIPRSGNHSGVAVGDINNDGNNDLYVYRWGNLSSRPSDYLLLNNGNGAFETHTMHSAKDASEKGQGDMGQIFDFDLDGNLDLLNGSDDVGMWYLYHNDTPNNGNYVLVDVGYAPESNIDPLGATVIVRTPGNEYKKRVASSGEIFSQSLMNIVHFGLGDETTIDEIVVRWRDGEEVIISDKTVNAIYDTDSVDPTSIVINTPITDIREGTTLQLSTTILPINANQEVVWSSSDPAITVDLNGLVTAVGTISETATITAQSAVNNVEGTVDLTIVGFFPVAVSSVELASETEVIIEGEEIALSATVLPSYADNKELDWESSDDLIATVDENGVVTSLADGVVTITARSRDNNTIFDTTEITIRELILASIAFDDQANYSNVVFNKTEPMTVTVDYHAGTGNTITAGDFRGIRFYLRHIRDTNGNWGVLGDILEDDSNALRTESGQATVSLDLSSAIPTAEMPEEEFYFLHIVANTSAGQVVSTSIVGIDIVGGTASIEEIAKIGSEMKIYPNPVVDELNVANLFADTATLKIYDSTGRLIIETVLGKDQPVLLEALSQGIYSMVISNGINVERFSFIKK